MNFLYFLFCIVELFLCFAAFFIISSNDQVIQLRGVILFALSLRLHSKTHYIPFLDPMTHNEQS
jgi:hypothetical protein